MAREIYARLDSDNPSNGGLVTSFFDDNPADPPVFYRSDDSRYRIHWLKKNPQNVPGRPHVYATRPVTVKMAAGVIDAEPDGGTFTITDTSTTPDETTAAIAYNASASAVQAAIRTALTTNFSAAVVTGADGGPWIIDRGATTAFTTDITANSDGLIPSGSTVNITNTQNGTSLLNEKWQVRLRKGMPFLCTSFSAFASVTTAATLVQAGSSTAKKIYSLTWNSDAVDGATYWNVSTTGSDNQTVGPIAYNATADEVKQAFIDGHSAIETGEIDVSQDGAGSYTVTFAIAMANAPTIGATASSNTLVVPVGDEADVAVATAESDGILEGEESAAIKFELEIRETSGKPRTIVSQATTLYADLITNTPGQTTGVDNFITESDLTAGTLTLVLGAGSAGSPTVRFTGDTDTGIYQVSADKVGISTGGTLRASFDSGGLTLNYGFKAPISAVLSDHYTAVTSDFTILFNLPSAKTLTLPAAASNSGRIYFIKNLPASSDSLNIDPNGAELIDDAAGYTVPAGGGIVIACDGTGWHIIATLPI